MDNGSLFDSGDAPQGGTSGEIQPYEFPFTGQEVRAVLINGQPWFVAGDVCAVLGYAHSGSALRMLRDREKGEHPMHTPGGVQDLKVISEPGLYRLIMRSNRPFAEPFQDWVVEVVLPSIRKTGSYGIPQQFDPKNLDHVVQLAQIAADQQKQITAQGEKIAELEPKAQQAEHHRAADGLKSVGDFANDVKAWAKRTHGVKVKHKEVWDHLARLKLIIRGNTVRHNHPTSFATEHDYIRPKETTFDRSGIDEVSVSPRLTPAGEGYAWDRITRFITENGGLTSA